MIGNVWEWTTDFWSTRHPADAPKACCVPQNPRGGRGGAELRPVPARDSHSPQGAERRLAPLRAELLPSLPTRRAPRRACRHIHEPCRLSLRGAPRPRRRSRKLTNPKALRRLRSNTMRSCSQSRLKNWRPFSSSISVRALKDLADRALAVDRRKQPLLCGVDEEREIRIGVARIDEHRGDASAALAP